MGRGFVFPCYSLSKCMSTGGIKLFSWFSRIRWRLSCFQSPGRTELLLATIETHALRWNTGVGGTRTLRVGGKLTGVGRYHSYYMGICLTTCGSSFTTFFSDRGDGWGDGRDNQPHFSGYGCFTVWQDLRSGLTIPPLLLLCGVPHCVCHCFGSDTPKHTFVSIHT